jgi:hypothetical protein
LFILEKNVIEEDDFLIHEVNIKRPQSKQKGNLQAYEEWKSSLLSLPLPHSACFYSPVSFPPYASFPPGLIYLNLNIYRESMIKTLIKERSGDLYRLLKKVHFDGNYYRVKCLRSGEREYCWDLAVRIQFFGMMQGLAFEPEKIIFRKSKKIIYRFLVLVNPYELWDKKLAERLWNLQERIEFLIAKILYHECIHILIFLGKTLPAGFKQTDVFLEFNDMLKFANYEMFCPESRRIQTTLLNILNIAQNFPLPLDQKQGQISEIYEFLIHEKYSIKKTDMAFGLSWSNKKISENYAKMAALKMGSYPDSKRELWNKEVNRLRKDLNKLYVRIDSSLDLRY